MSVPQMPARATRTSTSSGPTAGSGTVATSTWLGARMRPARMVAGRAGASLVTVT
jgi:hypothetical protein